MTAAARFTRDSKASESNPTDPVSPYAASFNTSVERAAAIESHA
jgi:hypothetical protein